MKQVYSEEDSQIIINLEESEFVKPFLIVDSLRKKEKIPEIIILEPPFDLSVINEVGINLYEIKVSKKEIWARGQKKIYYLRHADVPADEDSVEVKKLPANHYIEIDKANSKLRMFGPYISNEKNHTEWFFY
mgnify:CR=1 FL=1